VGKYQAQLRERRKLVERNITTETQYDSDGNIIMKSVIESMPPASSVNLKFTAKGEFTPEVKVYDADPDKAAVKALEIITRLISNPPPAP
jgi:hypothetical protein